MPRAGESQLSLSVRQEGSGAMRMLLRAAYSLTHEPENSSCVVHPVERASLHIYRRNNSLHISYLFLNLRTLYYCLTTASSITPFYLYRKEQIYFLTRSGSVHCGRLAAFGFGTNPFLIRSCFLQRKTKPFFVHALARGQDGVAPSAYAIPFLYKAPCAFRLTLFFSGTDDDVVKKLNTDDATDLDEPFGHLDIFP